MKASRLACQQLRLQSVFSGIHRLDVFFRLPAKGSRISGPHLGSMCLQLGKGAGANLTAICLKHRTHIAEFCKGSEPAVIPFRISEAQIACWFDRNCYWLIPRCLLEARQRPSASRVEYSNISHRETQLEVSFAVAILYFYPARRRKHPVSGEPKRKPVRTYALNSWGQPCGQFGAGPLPYSQASERPAWGIQHLARGPKDSCA